jgi:hypothetical protein
MKLIEALRSISDPRGYQGREYRLYSILLLVIVGKICGETSLAGVHRFGRLLSRKQREKLGFMKGTTPALSTITETLQVVDSGLLMTALSRVDGACYQGKQVAIDGKTLRGSASEGRNAVHCVSAFCEQLMATVGQLASRGKGFEIPDAMRLLEALDLTDVVISGDAMFCQETLCQTIEDKGGSYLFPVKDNQRTLKEDLNLLLDDPAVSKKNI